MKFDHMYNEDNTSTKTLREQAQEGWKRTKSTTLKEFRAFEKHKAKVADLTLVQGQKDIGARETESINGYTSIFIGSDEEYEKYKAYIADPTKEKPKVSLAENVKATVNAMLGVAAQKYKILDVNYHQVWFDPRTDAPAVLTLWDDKQLRWVVFDWKNGAFTPSKRVVPHVSGTRTDGNDQYFFQSNKHEAIRDWLASKDLGTSYLAVMTFDDQLAHYQRKIRDRIELPLTEVWELINQDNNEGSLKRSLTRGSTRTKAVDVSPEREEFLAELAEVNDDVLVVFTSPNTNRETTILFPASDSVAKDAALKRLRNANLSVQYIGTQEIEE
jgi:hypothetical protein